MDKHIEEKTFILEIWKGWIIVKAKDKLEASEKFEKYFHVTSGVAFTECKEVEVSINYKI